MKDIDQFLAEEESRILELYGNLRREETEVNNDLIRKHFNGNNKITLYSHIEPTKREREKEQGRTIHIF